MWLPSSHPVREHKRKKTLRSFPGHLPHRPQQPARPPPQACRPRLSGQDYPWRLTTRPATGDEEGPVPSAGEGRGPAAGRPHPPSASRSCTKCLPGPPPEARSRFHKALKPPWTRGPHVCAAPNSRTPRRPRRERAGEARQKEAPGTRGPRPRTARAAALRPHVGRCDHLLQAARRRPRKPELGASRSSPPPHAAAFTWRQRPPAGPGRCRAARSTRRRPQPGAGSQTAARLPAGRAHGRARAAALQRDHRTQPWG